MYEILNVFEVSNLGSRCTFGLGRRDLTYWFFFSPQHSGQLISVQYAANNQVDGNAALEFEPNDICYGCWVLI